MWWGIASLIALCVSVEFRRMLKTIPITTSTSVLKKYRQSKALLYTIRSVWSKGLWVTRKIVAGNGQIVKELLEMQIRTWVIKTYKLGDLESKQNHYILTYRKGEDIFKIFFPKIRKIRTIVSVLTPDGEDVTLKILQALGPGHNFYGIPTTPKLLGYPKGLKIEYRRGTIVHVLSDDFINPFES